MNRNETFFSSREFAEAWAGSMGDNLAPLAIPVTGSGPPRTMFAVQDISHYWWRHIALAPWGFYGSPGWDGRLEAATLQAILTRLRGIRTLGFDWMVRFDHEPLAAGLQALGLEAKRFSTHVLALQPGYEQVFAGYNATMRNQVRRAHRLGVKLRNGVGEADVKVFYQVYMTLARQKPGFRLMFPLPLFLNLAKYKEKVRLILAEVEGKVVAGGIFLLDGCSVFYLMGASDRDYSNFFPICAVIDEVIRWACDREASSFNFGGSGGMQTLEKFKEFWGARVEYAWKFKWSNPLWARISQIKAKLPSLSHIKAGKDRGREG
jgi:hypothetical protein